MRVVDRAAIDVAEIFRRYGEDYRLQPGSVLTSRQRRVMSSITQCRTAALGGHVEQLGLIRIGGQVS